MISLIKIGKTTGIAAGSTSVPGLIVKVCISIGVSIVTDYISKKVSQKIESSIAEKAENR